MHVCFVSREYPPNPMGGIGTYVMNMTHLLAEAGHTVTVLTQWCAEAPTKGLDQPALSHEGRLRVHYLPLVDANWALYPEAWCAETEALASRDLIATFAWVVAEALDQLVAQEPIQVVEAPEYEAPGLIWQLRRLTYPHDHPARRIPVITHLHSPSHSIFTHNDDVLDNHWVEARRTHEHEAIALADAVLSPSRFLAEQVAQWTRLTRQRLIVIPYPVGPLLEVPGDAVVVPGRCLHVGRVEPRKGVFEYVEAACRVARDFPEARFRFVGGPHVRLGREGDGETAELLRRLIPAELQDRFEWVGKVPRAELGREYASAQVCVVPSRWDNFPNTCVEAMEAGRPVLASDQGGQAEMVLPGITGWIAPGGPGAVGRAQLVDSLEQALREALATPLPVAEAMGAAARRRIDDFCDDAAVVRAHEDFYATLWQAAEQAPAVEPLTVEVRRDAGLALLDAADVIGWLPEGVELAEEALLRVGRFFAARPDVGFATVWREGGDGKLQVAHRVEAASLVHPAQYPEYWFIRRSAWENLPTPPRAGHYLDDRLRDVCLCLLEAGWQGAQIPLPLVRNAGAPLDLPVAGRFGFGSREDSARSVRLAHQGVIREHLELFLHDGRRERP
ncbi:MAG: glycosyltransferase family 4 protein [Verrucomicrobiota bacterium JB022]|nr:glycosyltransferase family 4 protein [Verrucomicrobiota bacterium JB022]